MRPLRVFALALALAVLAPSAARADLDEYLRKPEPAFKWEKKTEEVVDGCKVFELALTSLEWQGKPWEHKIVLVLPEKSPQPDFCALYNTGGHGGKSDTEMAVALAKKSGIAFAILFGVPSQPLWGKTEDALVVHTWLQFIESMKKDGKGDETWPLHHPMAKSVIKAMDAIQAFAKEAQLPAFERFLVCGASKRGWTTWLVGASKDPRVKAIAPMVIDTLNVPKQAVEQRAAYGSSGSEQIMVYSLSGLDKAFTEAEGKRLLELEDPWSYRERLTLPKLIINGTNDRYWPQDALNVYWDDLKGPKWVLYVPNSGHELKDRGRVLATLSAYIKLTAAQKSLPKLGWSYQALEDGGVKLVVESDAPLAEARIFKASAKARDFRESKWDFEKMEGEGVRWSTTVAKPEEGMLAIYGEAVYDVDGAHFTLSTQIRILGAPPAKKKKWY